MTSTDFFDQIESALVSKHPFVLFSKPDQQSIKAYIQSDLETHLINDFSESGFVFAPFDHTKDSYYIPFERSKILELNPPVFEDLINTNLFDEVESTKNHFNRVSKAIAEIKSSDLEKVVLSKEFKFSMEVSNPIEIFKKLSQSYPSAFTYCWFHPQTTDLEKLKFHNNLDNSIFVFQK